MTAPENSIVIQDGTAEWFPQPDIPKIGSIKGKGVGSAKLKSRKANPKRGIIGGKRTIAMWKVTGDDTFMIELRSGEHLQVLRLSTQVLDALEKLHNLHKHGPNANTWTMVYRVLNTAAERVSSEVRDAQ